MTENKNQLRIEFELAIKCFLAMTISEQVAILAIFRNKDIGVGIAEMFIDAVHKVVKTTQK